MPDLSGVDSAEEVLADLVAEAAEKELARAIRGTPDRRIVASVVKVALSSIQSAIEAGALARGNSQADECQARLLAEIIDAPNSKMHAQCIDFVFGHGIMMGISETQIAALHGMTKSTVSAICVGICKRYNVKPGRGMKTVEARESYKIRQTGRRAKPMREDWTLGSTLRNAFAQHGHASN